MLTIVTAIFFPQLFSAPEPKLMLIFAGTVSDKKNCKGIARLIFLKTIRTNGLTIEPINA